jgi:hypothetical protein
LLWDAIRGFLTPPLATTEAAKDMHQASWFTTGFAQRNRAALRRYPSRVKVFGPLPSFQNHIYELNQVRRFLAWWGLNPAWLRDVRLPYLDRDLLEFTYAVPREQLVRVGQRRSLMKRALIGIVPEELLNRKRTRPPQQALTPRPQKDSSLEWPSLIEMGQKVVSNTIEIVDRDCFLEALDKARRNEEVPINLLQHSLTLESWLRHLAVHGVLSSSTGTKRQNHILSLEARGFQSTPQTKRSAS